MFRPHPFTTRRFVAAALLAMAACDSQDQFSPEPATEDAASATPELLRKVSAIVLTPTSVTLQPGGSQQFTATARMSDGTTTSASVTWTATGGSVTTAGKYWAGQTAGTYRVIATKTGGGRADTSTVTIAATAPLPPPPPSGTGKTFFSANAETANLGAWSLPWGVVQYQGTVTTPTVRPKYGSYSYRYDVTNNVSGTVGHDVRTMTAHPQTSMGGPSGHYMSGYYSFWAYIDAGYTAPGWNLLLGWMTGVQGAPSPISNIGIENRNGVTQLMFQLKNATYGLYTAPTIPGYTMYGNGWYYMNSSSPAGVKPFPRNQWVHLSVYYKMAPSNGQVTIWQDGVRIMDLTAPAMNTYGGHSSNLTNSGGDMMLQFGVYGAPKADGAQRLFVDDFKVTDTRVTP